MTLKQPAIQAGSGYVCLFGGMNMLDIRVATTPEELHAIYRLR